MVFMNIFKSIKGELKFWEECRKYGVSVWECPKFLFIVMGAVTGVGMVLTHLVAVRYADPEIAVVSVTVVTILMFTMGNIIVKSFEKVAKASRLKTEFVSIVSHQLRSPLTALKWSLNLLSSHESRLDANERQYLEIIREGNERMIKLVNDLLNVSQIDQGRLSYTRENFDIVQLVGSLVSELKGLADANNIKLEIKSAADQIYVNADKQYITMVLNNFMDNAMKYIPGTGQVEISLNQDDKFLTVKVKDNGIGIPADEQKNIFHKFFRSAAVMRHKTEGTGLGLFLAKAFIEAHGGKIGFTSTESQGTTFWFTLPLNRASGSGNT